jgi:hypothetical protein
VSVCLCICVSVCLCVCFCSMCVCVCVFACVTVCATHFVTRTGSSTLSPASCKVQPHLPSARCCLAWDSSAGEKLLCVIVRLYQDLTPISPIVVRPVKFSAVPALNAKFRWPCAVSAPVCVLRIVRCIETYNCFIIINLYEFGHKICLDIIGSNFDGCK